MAPSRCRLPRRGRLQERQRAHPSQMARRSCPAAKHTEACVPRPSPALGTPRHSRRGYRIRKRATADLRTIRPQLTTRTSQMRPRVIICCESALVCPGPQRNLHARPDLSQEPSVESSARLFGTIAIVLVCRYARSLGLAARQNTPAIDAAIYHPDSTLYQLQLSFHTHSTEPEPTARARRAGEEFY